MEDKARVRPGLNSPDRSQDVEYAIDRQIDEVQHEREENEGRGPLGPPKTEKRYKPNGKRLDLDRQSETPELKKQPSGAFPKPVG